MNAGVQQIANLPPPSAAAGNPAESPAGGKGFEHFLDSAIKKSSFPRQPEPPLPPATPASGKPELRVKPSHNLVNPQTPATMPVAADPNTKLPPAEVESRFSGIDHALANGPQRSVRRLQVLGELAAGQFQPDATGSRYAAEAASGQPKQVIVPSVRDQEGQNQDRLPMMAKGLARNAPSHSLLPPQGRSASADASPAPKSRSLPLSPATNLLEALSDKVKQTSGQEVTGRPDLPAVDSAKQAPSPANAQPPTQAAPEANFPGAQAKPLQNALAEMENLQLHLFSRTTSGNAAPPPSGMQGSKPLNLHAADGRAATDSADAPRQKQEAAAFQNSGKDAGISNAGAAQDASKGFSLNTTASGPTSDSAKDGKSGQDLSARHFDAAAPQGSGNTAAPGSFSSVAASATAASANAMSALPGQPAAANSTPANTGSPSQPGASHAAAVANKMTASVENPVNPAGGVINTASMLQSQGKTEMRVAMQTENLGPLELHAVLDGGHLGASIAVVNHEAHTLLTNSLPSLQQVLNDQNLRVDHLSVLNAATSSGTNTGNGSRFQSGGQPQSRPNAPRWAFATPAQTVPVMKESPSVAGSLRGRLSVRA